MNNCKMSSSNIAFSEKSSLSHIREKWVDNITIDDSTLVVVFRSYGCLLIHLTKNRSRAETILHQVCNLDSHLESKRLITHAQNNITRLNSTLGNLLKSNIKTFKSTVRKGSLTKSIRISTEHFFLFVFCLPLRGPE